jgi:farnesyl-diphosphate farnesyltransferase
VAGRVGFLLTELFALESATVARQRADMMALGRQFGLGLQTVNVIRGLHEDRFRGWVYVPKEFVGRSIVDPQELFAPGRETDALDVLDRLVQKSQRHLEAAVEYTIRIPRRMKGVRVFCALPLFFAIRTLGVSRGNADVFRQEVKISRAEVRAIVLRTEALVSSNTWIRRYAGELGLSA